MAIGYTWNVSTVDTYPTKDSKSDVVYNVHWRLTATDDTNNSGNYSAPLRVYILPDYATFGISPRPNTNEYTISCLLYTSAAADE